MNQIGQVVEIQGKNALVRVRRASSCGENCSCCSGECKPTASTLKAINGLDAKVGDMVKVEMNPAAYVFLAFVGYILPIIITVLVYITVNHFTSDAVVADVCAIAALIVTLAVFYFADKIPKKSTVFSSRIIRILR